MWAKETASFTRVDDGFGPVLPGYYWMKPCWLSKVKVLDGGFDAGVKPRQPVTSDVPAAGTGSFASVPEASEFT